MKIIGIKRSTDDAKRIGRDDADSYIFSNAGPYPRKNYPLNPRHPRLRKWNLSALKRILGYLEVLVHRSVSGAQAATIRYG